MNGRISNTSKVLVAMCLTLVFTSFALSQKKESDIKLEAVSFINGYDLEARQSTDLRRQFKLLYALAPAAVAAGEPKKAEIYANKLMSVARKMESEHKYAPFYPALATHTSNIVLGRIAFDAGNIDKAKEYLLAAVQMKGNIFMLSATGPNMSLAKQLLEKGEREIILQYFDLCGNFWKQDEGKLEDWKDVVKEGGIPDFKYNLDIFSPLSWTVVP